MNIADFVITNLSLMAWREGKRLSPGCRPAMLGIALVIRNRVEVGWSDGDWIKIIEDAPIHAAENIEAMDFRSLPDIRDKDFLWLQSQVVRVYDRTLQDEITCSANVNWAAHDISKPREMPRKGLFYCNLQLPIRPWFLENIIRRPNDHFRQAEAGNVTFYS